MKKLNLFLLLLAFCAVFTNVFFKIHSKYLYAYDAINDVYLECNVININLIGFGIAIIIAFIIYNKFLPCEVMEGVKE